MAMKRRSKSAASEAARYLSSLGASNGGKASAAALTPEQRKAKAKAAIAARWADRTDLPIDQASVMRRLEGVDSVDLRIAPGSGGRRRLAAIRTLEASGRILVLTRTAAEITVAWPTSTHK